MMVEEEKAKEIKREYDQLKQDRQVIDQLRQEIAEYILPLREDFRDVEVASNSIQSLKKGKNIYDGTAVSALNLAADGFHGYMISPAMKWFLLKLPSKMKFLEKLPEVRTWMQDVTEAMYAEFQNSNFYSEMRVFLRDGLSVSPGALFIEDDMSKGRVCFNALHPNEVYLAEDIHRNVDKVIRHVWYTARQAVQMFGKDKLSLSIQNSFENNPFQRFEFLHSVSPREDFDTRKIDAINKPYKSVWIEKGGKVVLRESGFDMFPYMVWRYALNSRNPYGDTPATFALPEVKRLNIISKSVAGAAQLTVEPPYNIPAEMKGKVRLTPHGMNYYGSDANRRIYPINTGINFPIALDREEQIRSLIKDHWHVDFFMMLAQAEREMTATQAAEIIGEKALVLGAATVSLTTALDNIIDYVAYLGMKAGRIPEPPDVVKMFAGGERIDIVYTGTLAQAQRRLFETLGITRSLEMVAPIIGMYIDAGDVINADESVRKILISNGYPQDALNTDEQIAQKRQARADAQGVEAQKQDQERMSEVLKKLSQAAKNAGINLQELMTNAGM